ncbi:MAG TPA: AraC family transcriptional regulator, partial [Bacilli bacterium]
EQELTNSMLKLSSLLKEKEHQNKNVIYEIARYIENHYDQDITLQDISAHFYLSREYISRWFKQEFQENITDYISRKRMEKAKILLANRHMRIAEIAKIVGYQDEKYFSKVFKKLEGLSPNEYRKKQDKTSL